MKTKTSLLLLLFIMASISLMGCGDDKTKTVNNTSRGNDTVFGGLPGSGITVLLNGARLYPDDAPEDPGTLITFSMNITPTNQFVQSGGMKYIPNYVTFPTGPTGPLSFFAVTEGDYTSSTSPIRGYIFPWYRIRWALEGNGEVYQLPGDSRYYFRGDLVAYTINGEGRFELETRTFGIRIGWGGVDEPQRMGSIR